MPGRDAHSPAPSIFREPSAIVNIYINISYGKLQLCSQGLVHAPQKLHMKCPHIK